MGLAFSQLFSSIDTLPKEHLLFIWTTSTSGAGSVINIMMYKLELGFSKCRPLPNFNSLSLEILCTTVSIRKEQEDEQRNVRWNWMPYHLPYDDRV